MSSRLKVSHGQHSEPGRKAANQDFCGYRNPAGSAEQLKGAVFAIADGISSSPVSQQASETAVKSFLGDYYCTSDAWTVKRSAERVLKSINSWLFAQSRQGESRFDPDKGYVTTFSAIIFKGDKAHLLHVGDSRIYRIRAGTLEQLTIDHRLYVAESQSYLSRALGAAESLELDYRCFNLQAGDLFLLATDGVYEHLSPNQILNSLHNPSTSLHQVSQKLVEQAHQQGSEDNLSLQIIRVEEIPQSGSALLQEQLQSLPMPPELAAGQSLDGYKIVRPINITSRSHCYLAVDETSGSSVVLKVPAQEQRDDRIYLERFLMEEWIARRVNNLHVVKAAPAARERHYLYTVTEFIEGQTLSQWLLDHPKPDLTSVRNLIEQIGRGLMAFHRLDMLHQDIKPDNVLIDQHGTAKIIDFGSTYVAGIEESEYGQLQPNLLGTALYTAPEYFLGDMGSERSDIFALGVLTYHLLCGQFPYGTQVAKARTPSAQKRLSYQSLLHEEREIPAWVDAAIKKAVHPNPYRRYQEVAEFLRDLQKPNPEFLAQQRPPFIERNPTLFWQCVSGVLLAVVIVQFALYR
ncbi:bifunctional protein-serine/threonine kinase/phosphatase [Halioxenophilus sp. WMMB6]|uniref:bifunctional protein-serine/threonine kinase/phosphatase n=1 Tax=Halioxenophilus sp. WMMB6 TaxID=3073815 RepID=UPI00295E7E3B|nr:bifunctional protein-serine/threonine kinase/phosphatase [Halioxenophilus sp. WMMB6]